MPVQPTVRPARCASGNSSAPSQARLLSALATLREALAPDVALNLPAVLDEAALLVCLSVFTTNATAPTTVPAPTLTAVRPPRQNFAGHCQVCGMLGCSLPECIEVWSQTTWILCSRCDGYGGAPANFAGCGCYLGVVPNEDDGPEPVYYVTAAPLVITELAEKW